MSKKRTPLKEYKAVEEVISVTGINDDIVYGLKEYTKTPNDALDVLFKYKKVSIRVPDGKHINMFNEVIETLKKDHSNVIPMIRLDNNKFEIQLVEGSNTKDNCWVMIDDKYVNIVITYSEGLAHFYANGVYSHSIINDK